MPEDFYPNEAEIIDNEVSESRGISLSREANKNVSFQTLQKETWITKDGTEMSIKKMKDSHITNCIRMLEKEETSELVQAYIDTFRKELKKRTREIEK